MATVFFLTRLKDGADQAAYEKWVEEYDYPTCIRNFKSITYYQAYKTAPMLRAIGKRTGLGEKRLHELFPLACRECMCRIAGLPRPSGCTC